jgi:hypothetical protein
MQKINKVGVVIDDLSNRDVVGVVENFNINKLMEIINHE